MFIEFTAEQKQQANEADIVALLERNGQQVRKVGSQYEWKGTGRSVSILENLWFDHYDQTGGNTLSFVKKYFGLSYPEAMQFILGEHVGKVIDKPPMSNAARVTNPATTRTGVRTDAQKEFQLPPRTPNMRRAKVYLETTRGISSEIVEAFARNDLIYETADYHNVAFVGKDSHGVPRHVQKRSTGKTCGWRANQAGSDARYSFNWRGRANKVYLFEAPIDMLSFIDMNRGEPPYERWHYNNYIAACSLSELPLMQMLEDSPQISRVFICFDNDSPGQRAASILRQRLETSGYDAKILVPKLKDWNEDLLYMRQEEGESVCQTESPLLSL
ncbi:MAG: DUF3991 and TOPRIM domain-containing protein [Clostridiales bacterium]|nr:DUF3991 and TOPRIM domain-containing protein [Clostridiales bacterium]